MTGEPRTYLFVPADRPDRFAKALGSGAERVILDLEDAVLPDAKPAAREAIAAADLDWARVVVRVNNAASAEWEQDLATLARVPAAAAMVPKAECAARLAELRRAAGREIEVLPQIETAAGLEALDAILRAPGVRRAAFGHLDFAADIGAAPDWEALLLARSTLVLRSRLAGRAAPVESVTTEIADTELVERETEAARRLGFGAKLLIHPAQVAPVAGVFAPSAEEIAWARRVIEAGRAAGAVRVDGRMVDKPVIDAARRILARTTCETDEETPE
jgi:citrate lyase subunit beta/citryl-CoA lyase